MIKEKELKLKEKLKNIIKEIGYNQDIKDDIADEFINRNLSSYKAILVFKENLDLNTLSSEDEDIRFLFVFTYALSKALKKRERLKLSITLEDYFTEVEIKQWKNYKEAEKSKSIFPIVIKNVQKVSDKIWQTVLSAQQLNELDIDNLLIYNFKTQRNPKITRYGEQINIDTKKISQIKERMLKGEQYPDPIILNILNNLESKLVYEEKNNTIIIFDGSVINIVDGFHRKTANSLALEENPNLNFNWQITFTFLSEKAAHDYMAQKDKQKPMKREWIEGKDYNRAENLVIEVIMDDKKSELVRVMKDDDDYIKLNSALTKKSIVAQAIKECYNDMLDVDENIRNINVRNIGRWVVEFTNYLMEYYVDEFIINPYKVKETSMINNKNMFFGFIALSAKLMNDNDWQNKLIQKMQSIDFSKDNLLWKDIGIIQSNKDINKTQRNKLYSLFTEGVE